MSWAQAQNIRKNAENARQRLVDILNIVPNPIKKEAYDAAKDLLNQSYSNNFEAYASQCKWCYFKIKDMIDNYEFKQRLYNGNSSNYNYNEYVYTKEECMRNTQKILNERYEEERKQRVKMECEKKQAILQTQKLQNMKNPWRKFTEKLGIYDCLEVRNNMLKQLQQKNKKGELKYIVNVNCLWEPRFDKYDECDKIVNQCIDKYKKKIKKYSSIKENILAHLKNAGINSETELYLLQHDNHSTNIDNFISDNSDKLNLIIVNGKYVMAKNDGYDILLDLVNKILTKSHLDILYWSKILPIIQKVTNCHDNSIKILKQFITSDLLFLTYEQYGILKIKSNSIDLFEMRLKNKLMTDNNVFIDETIKNNNNGFANTMAMNNNSFANTMVMNNNNNNNNFVALRQQIMIILNNNNYSFSDMEIEQLCYDAEKMIILSLEEFVKSRWSYILIRRQVYYYLNGIGDCNVDDDKVTNVLEKIYEQYNLGNFNLVYDEFDRLVLLCDLQEFYNFVYYNYYI